MLLKHRQSTDELIRIRNVFFDDEHFMLLLIIVRYCNFVMFVIVSNDADDLMIISEILFETSDSCVQYIFDD